MDFNRIRWLGWVCTCCLAGPISRQPILGSLYISGCNSINHRLENTEEEPAGMICVIQDWQCKSKKDSQSRLMKRIMLSKGTNLNKIVYLIAGLALGLCLGLLAGIVIARIPAGAPGNVSKGQTPVRVVKITVDPDQRQQLFTQMQKFGDKWAYAVRIAPAEASGKFFRVDLWRSDTKILGLYTEGTLSLAFSYTDPAHPVPEQFFDEEIDDLKSFIGEIEGATLSVK